MNASLSRQRLFVELSGEAGVVGGTQLLTTNGVRVLGH